MLASKGFFILQANMIERYCSCSFFEYKILNSIIGNEKGLGSYTSQKFPIYKLYDVIESDDDLAL
jgi:hypothetical protein